MNILVIGSGGREHAIVKAFHKNLSKHPDIERIVCFGPTINPGIDVLAKSYSVDVCDGDAIEALIRKEKLLKKIRFAIIGPEAPLEAGIADLLHNMNIPSVGPYREFAKLETSKLYCRNILNQYQNTYQVNPDYTEVKDLKQAELFIQRYSEKFVIKEDGLRSGKGVMVCGDHFNTDEEGLAICKDLLERNVDFLLEEKLIGQEFSLMSFSDGLGHFSHMPPVQDFKRAYENNLGPNTGGMGSIIMENNTLPFLTMDDIKFAQNINQSVVIQLYCTMTRLYSYRGILYGSFIKTKNGKIKVIEYNCRFGDPECINLLHLLKNDFIQVCLDTVYGKLGYPLEFGPSACVCKYMVPVGYPKKPSKNFDIYFSNDFDFSNVIYGSVSKDGDHLYQKGSRTLAYVGTGHTLLEAAEKVNRQLDKVHGRLFYRKDIGLHRASKYELAGVDIDKGNTIVAQIQQHVQSTYNKHVIGQHGAFNGMYALDNDTVLVSSTDGVGTKSTFARNQMGDNGFLLLGYDIVHHSINDILVSGATPLFFLDYFASSDIKTNEIKKFVEGVAFACKQNNCVLIGGETAEMPGIYREDKVDLVGTIVGKVERKEIIDPKKQIKEGDIVIGLPSSGLHTNGYSLVRKIMENITETVDEDIYRDLLFSHRCYLNEITLLKNAEVDIHGLCHITGGGLIDNPVRILPDNLSMELEQNSWKFPRIFSWLMEKGKISYDEMLKVFNCGIGMLIIIPQSSYDQLHRAFEDKIFYKMGSIVPRQTLLVKII